MRLFLVHHLDLALDWTQASAGQVSRCATPTSNAALLKLFAVGLVPRGRQERFVLLRHQ